MTSMAGVLYAQQLPNSNFDDWSGTVFDGNPQPKDWNVSNVTQFGFKFNFAHKEAGRSGSCVMIQDQEVGAAGITEVSPSYFTLGQPWVYVASLTQVSAATAGTYGGIQWSYRPDTMSVWIKRIGDNVTREDFYLLYYAWEGTARGTKYKGKNGSCTSVEYKDEESDVRQALNGNECGTEEKVNQISEGMWREMKEYGEWTNIRVPIYYFNNTVPEKLNIIFSASNYPNFRANSGLYAGNSLYVDDLELIYSSKIQKLYINGVEWKGFDPNSTDIQYYALGESATAIPSIEAKRGAGSLTNTKGATANFPGRTLSGKEIEIKNGDLDKTPTTITVKSEDGKSTTVYKIQFQKAASSNAKLAGISIDLDGKQTPLADFSPTKYNYTVDLPYGTKTAPVVLCDKQEDKQEVAITQPTSPSGTAKIVVTAPNGKATATYNLTFRLAELADNTLADIKVNGSSLVGFVPSQAVYKVSLPVGTSTLTVEPVSAYEKGAQTIVVTPDPLPKGEAINGSTVQISVTTPGNKVAKVYKLNIKLEASSYSYLKSLDVKGDQVQQVNPAKTDDPRSLAFAPDNMTYYVTLKMGTKALPAIEYTPGDDYQKVAVDTTGGIDGTTRVTVTAGNGDQSVYKLIFSTEKSEISTLQGILIDGEPLADFKPEVLSYTYNLPVGTTELPTIEPIAADEFQTITVTTAGINGKTRITVTAGNGSTTIYQIAFSVATFSDNTLKNLAVEGYDIDFDPEVTEYYVNLAKGTTALPNITYELKDAKFQTATERKPAGLNGDYKLTVRPQSGSSRTYIIHFSLNKSSNTELKAIYVDGEALVGFDPDSLHYIDSLPEGVSRIPSVTFDKAEESQRVLSVLEDTKQILTVTAESGATRVYTIEFIVRVSANAFLNMIYLDGDSLAGFDSETLNYEVELTSGRCPAITVDKAAGQQVTITAPYAEGIAQIKVQPGVGAANIYRITFTAPKATAAVQLSAILVNGKAIDGFSPAKTSYEQSYEGVLPTVEGVKGDETQTVSDALWRDSVASIHVADKAGNSALYSVVFHRVLRTDNTLKGIYADGVLLPDFDKTKTNYSYSLAPGTALPNITYEAEQTAQVVFFGQTQAGEWQIKVASEKGDFATYTVRYTIEPYSELSPLDIRVKGHELDFAADKTNYALTIDEGAALPQVTVTPRTAQRVLVYASDDTHQQIVVTAENGDSRTYTITYTRTLSNNARLEGILINGQRLEAFDADQLAYTVTLPKSTKVVPNIYPEALLDNQTITTYYSRPNGTTRIHVVAQDGTSARDYTIAFPVQKSTNTKLGSLKINGEEKDVNETDFVFQLPYGSVNPYKIECTKAEEEQLIDSVIAPLNGVTRITVKAENGDTRVYSIRYQVAQPEGANILTNIAYEYTDKNGTKHNGSIVPQKGDNIIDLPYGAKSFRVTDVTKSYEQQSVLKYDGGIRRGATLIAVANREGEPDVRYTLTPRIPEFDTYNRLKSLSFVQNGDTIDVPNFRPDVYNYMINVTKEPKKDSIIAIAYDDAQCKVGILNRVAKKTTITVGDAGTQQNEYTLCWFYEEDKDPFDFSNEWINAGTTGTKPSAEWRVIADYSAGHDYSVPVVNYPIPYKTGLEVTRAGSNAVLLSTIRQGAIRASIPGMMTLGEMSVNLNDGSFTPTDEDGCNSTTSVTITESNGMVFRNTPDQFKFQYQPQSGKDNGINQWSVKLWLTGKNTSNGSLKVRDTVIYGNYESTLLRDTTIELKGMYPEGTMAYINATLNSCHTENCHDMGTLSGTQSSRLLLQNMHLLYNSELTSATVNDSTKTPVGNVFTFGVDSDYIGVPDMRFKGQVADQTQTIEWLNDGEWLHGQLTARIVNYGENSKDSTHYYVVLKRAAVESMDYEVDYVGKDTLPTSKIGDTTFVTLPYGHSELPNITITPSSIHQRFAIAKNGEAVTVTVTAEDGTSATAVYVFRETLSDDATVEQFEAGEDVKDLKIETAGTDTTFYSFTKATMPKITFERPDGVQGQTVAMSYTADRATLVVTAADGVHQHTYIFDRKEPVVATTAVLEDFTIGGKDAGLGGGTMETTKERPTVPVFFERKFDTDSVVCIQDPTKTQWQVFGSVNKTYTLNYPTTQSAKTNLGAILLNGDTLKDFNELEYEYTIESDSAVWLTMKPLEKVQQVTTAQEQQGDSVIYTTEVTAADGVHKQAYKVIVHRSHSDNCALSAITCDGVLLSGFHPDTLNYTVVLPTPTYKQATPQMPSIAYVAGEAHQTIESTPVLAFGEPTEITVHAETGETRTYMVTVQAEPSHCADLSAILVNGNKVAGFEPGRHFYSVSLSDVNAEIDYMSNDRFQTVARDTVIVKDSVQYRYQLQVTAEDAVTSSVYEVEVYVENKSNDAQLASITLDGKQFVDFERALNEELTFDPGNNLYTINLPAGTTLLPEVNAQLKMAGQTVDMDRDGQTVLLKVTAVDGVTTNIYTLHFVIPLSKNANLSMIFLNGDSLPDFAPNVYFYQIELPVGTHELPEVVAQKSESVQTIVSNETDTDKLQTTIVVQAEDASVRVSTYTIVFRYTQSDADTLMVILADGDTLPGFTPQNLYYSFSLPVGTDAFPSLDYEPADEWQTVTMETVEQTPSTLIRQLFVTSESGKKNTYTVSYTILKSDVDTLQMIIVDQKQLSGFKATEDEYYYTLTAAEAEALNGALPPIDWITGDEYQTVAVLQAVDSLSGKSLGFKSLVTVTAATGKMRIYTIHYPVELSTEATLNMILLGGKPLSNFDAERFVYKTEIERDATIPVVSVIKKENAQNYEIRVVEDTVLIDVQAEDIMFKQTYTLYFERLMSANALLRDIILRDSEGATFPTSTFFFRSEVFAYDAIDLPYRADVPADSLLPKMEFVLSDSLQTVDTVRHELPNGDIQIEVNVTAPNGEDQVVYTLTFHWIKPSDAFLSALLVGENLIDDFDPAITEYTYKHPFGTTEEQFLTLADITYERSDSLATDTAYMDEDKTIFITVTAQDLTTEQTYMIRQIVGLDNNNYLKCILLDGDTLKDFDPEISFYTYVLAQGAVVPAITAIPMSEYAEEPSVREVSAGDTCTITCQAADGSMRHYYIYFPVTTINDGLEPNGNDVLMKTIKGAPQLMVGTLRKGVSFALYDKDGRLQFYAPVPVADPNDAEVYSDAEGKDVLNNVSDPNSTLIVDVNYGQVYFYSFIVDDKKKLSTGKILLQK